MRTGKADFSDIEDISAAAPENTFIVYWDGEAARLVHSGERFETLLSFEKNDALQAWLHEAFAGRLPLQDLLCLEADGLPTDHCLLCIIRALGERAAGNRVFLMEGLLSDCEYGRAAVDRQRASNTADCQGATPSSSSEPNCPAAAYEAVIAAMPDMIWMINPQGRVSMLNAAAKKFIGTEAGGSGGSAKAVADFSVLQDLVEPDEAEGEGPSPLMMERSVRDPATGTEIFLEIRKGPVRDAAGDDNGILYVARDVTRAKHLELELNARKSELIAHAYSDPLTDMPNRRHFAERIEKRVSGLAKSGGQAALLMIDLDRFSAVNDSVGRSAGDLVLAEMGRRIRKATDAVGGYAARLNGDEFGVIIEGASTTDTVTRLAESILTAVSEPFFSGSWVLTITASIGIVIIPDHASEPEALLRYADIAMHEAKRAGQNTWRIFDDSAVLQAQERFELEADIRRSLAQDQFTSHFQAKIDLETGEIAGIEALMRWKHPRRGNIPPAIFIPLAEETGLIVPLGEKILTDACHFARRWNDGSSTPVRVAVNLSPRQVMFDDFLPLLKACLSRTGCRPEWLELEMTENILLSDQRRIDELMQGLELLGVSIALDDFGTGYSAISYLTRYPISTLKIDRSFVHDVTRKGRNAAVAKAIISMANGLGMTTVAEGIETAEEAAFMRLIGCAQGQGYLWHRPMPEDALTGWAATLRQERIAQ